MEDISKEIQKIPEEEKPKIVPSEIAEKEEDIAEAVSEVPVARDELDVRKEKFIKFIKKPKVWVIFLLIIALILGIYIRSIPMHTRDDTGNPGLWNIATDSWTLGPDLDPWLFLRYGKYIIEDGSLPQIDNLRNVPLGFEPAKETRLLPYMIAWTYKISKLFYPEANVEFAGALLPVIMFALTIISFFLFVREVFVRKSRRSRIKANIIALISTFFMIVIPVFLSRTIAGIPEKESAGFFFMFLAFYLFLKAWKSEKNKSAYIFGVLAGLSTALMGLIWGGVMFVYIPVAGAIFIAFILNKIRKKEFITYSLWIWAAILISIIFSKRMTLSGMLTSLSSGLAFLIFFILLIHFILWNTKLSKKFEKMSRKIPKNILSIIISLIILILFASIIFGPGFIIDKIKAVHQMIFKPTIGRWNTTVAENRQPFFTEWENSFGPYLRGIALMFWLFFVGSIVFFKETLNKLSKKASWMLTLGFILVLIGMIFTRYSAESLFNGENFISKAVYYLAILFFFWLLYKYYYKSKEYKKEEGGFNKIDFENIFLLILFLLGVFSARSSVRTIMVLGPIAPIFVGYLITKVIEKFRKSKDESGKIFLGILGIIIIIMSLFTFVSYYKNTKSMAHGHIPSNYNQQWQKAMEWVKTNTPEDAVFAHWWDYGYWVQSIGERATVLDGGNAISFWNYYMGRLVLTGDNQKDALEFLYTHDADYLLIDSSDIGKYGAFSSIGSDENYDRYSWIPIMVSDPKQSTETSEGIIRIYQGGSAIDEDIVYEINGTEIFLPSQKTAIMGVMVESEGVSFKQPIAIFYYNGEHIQIPLRYLEFDGEFFDFEAGLEGGVKVIQRIDAANGKVINQGALIYVSPRVLRGFLAQKYLFDDPFGNFPNFEIEYQEDDLIIEMIREQDVTLNEFVYYNGLRGPIKIWKIEYTGKEEIQDKYLDTDSSKYLSWKL